MARQNKNAGGEKKETTKGNKSEKSRIRGPEWWRIPSVRSCCAPPALTSLVQKTSSNATGIAANGALQKRWSRYPDLSPYQLVGIKVSTPD